MIVVILLLYLIYELDSYQQAQWSMPVIPALCKWKQEHKFKASLDKQNKKIFECLLKVSLKNIN